MEVKERSHRMITKRDESRILLFCEIAQVNGSLLSIKELSVLALPEFRETEIESIWNHSKVLSSRYALNSGLIFAKRSNIPESAIEESRRRARAETNINMAKRFGSCIADSRTNVLSISGSASYHSVSKTDDIDFFTITSRDTMWLFMTKSLLLARFWRLVYRPKLGFCFSYTMDEGFAKREFTRPRDGLFARDALNAIVIRGHQNYRKLLFSSSWMSEYFPRLYKERIGSIVAAEENKKRSPFFHRILNLFLYFTIGKYIRIKSGLLNKRFRSSKKDAKLFSLKMGQDHCIFESHRYLEFRRIYSRLDNHPDLESRRSRVDLNGYQ